MIRPIMMPLIDYMMPFIDCMMTLTDVVMAEGPKTKSKMSPQRLQPRFGPQSPKVPAAWDPETTPKETQNHPERDPSQEPKTTPTETPARSYFC